MAIKKGIEQAKKNLIKLNLKGATIPHQVLGRYGSAQVLLKPASEGTGVIAGGPVRKVMQVAGFTRADEINRHLKPPQCRQGYLRGAPGLEGYSARGRNALQTVEEISGKPPKERPLRVRATSDRKKVASTKTPSSPTTGRARRQENPVARLKIKWVVSFISCTDDMRQTIRGLGLRRMHQVVERQDTPAVRGMIHKVRHLVAVVE